MSAASLFQKRALMSAASLFQKRALMSAAEGNHFPQGNQYSLPGQHCWRAARSRNKPAGTHRGRSDSMEQFFRDRAAILAAAFPRVA